MLSELSKIANSKFEIMIKFVMKADQEAQMILEKKVGSQNLIGYHD